MESWKISSSMIGWLNIWVAKLNSEQHNARLTNNGASGFQKKRSNLEIACTQIGCRSPWVIAGWDWLERHLTVIGTPSDGTLYRWDCTYLAMLLYSWTIEQGNPAYTTIVKKTHGKAKMGLVLGFSSRYPRQDQIRTKSNFCSCSHIKTNF